MTSARFVFVGKISQTSFEEFARHRAQRLDIGIEVGRADVSRFTVSVSGAEALVDMFEMACSLGPHDCIIYDVERSDTP